MACLLALIHRIKTGQGQFIDISMQDVLYFNNYRAMVDRAMDPIVEQVEQLLGRKPKDVLNSADRMPFYGFFRSKDGKVAIVALTPRQWKDLSETVGRPELVTDARFSNLIGQIHNHAAAVALIEEWTSQHTSEEIISALESRRIPCGTAYSSEQVNRDENLGKRRMFAKVHHEVLGDIDVPGIPFQFSETQGTVRLPAPGLGEHNRLILGQWLGLSEEEIEGLYRLKVLV
jgi:crotonobetainyl-CoA:carnitine CoA-transferase CaiB-like acyl-CoA transferase